MRRVPRSPWIALLLLAVVALSAPVARARTVRMALAPGDPAPGCHGTTLAGQSFAADYAASKVTVVNFWATWCEPCKEEMPALQRLHDERSADGLNIVGMLMEYVEDEPLRAFLDDMGITYTVLRPRKDADGKWGGLTILPITVLVDQKGAVLRRYVGATPEQIDGLVFDIVAALEGRPLGPVIIPETPNHATEAQDSGD